MNRKRNRMLAIALIAALAIVITLILGRRPDEDGDVAGRDHIDVPDVGRVYLATDEEREYWREQYAPEPEGGGNGYDHT